MRKRKQGRTLSRNKAQRQALKRTMLVSLVEFGSIKTTLAKAKELRPFAERVITKVKRIDGKNLSAGLRQLKTELPFKSVKKLVEVADKYKSRQGGYTRIIKLAPRLSDSAEMAIIEFVDAKKDNKKEVKKEDNEKGGDKEGGKGKKVKLTEGEEASKKTVAKKGLKNK